MLELDGGIQGALGSAGKYVIVLCRRSVLFALYENQLEFIIIVLIFCCSTFCRGNSLSFAILFHPFSSFLIVCLILVKLAVNQENK